MIIRNQCDSAAKIRHSVQSCKKNGAFCAKMCSITYYYEQFELFAASLSIV